MAASATLLVDDDQDSCPIAVCIVSNPCAVPDHSFSWEGTADSASRLMQVLCVEVLLERDGQAFLLQQGPNASQLSGKNRIAVK
jgi:hypothetical protein